MKILSFIRIPLFFESKFDIISNFQKIIDFILDKRKTCFIFDHLVKLYG